MKIGLKILGKHRYIHLSLIVFEVEIAIELKSYKFLVIDQIVAEFIHAGSKTYSEIHVPINSI